MVTSNISGNCLFVSSTNENTNLVREAMKQFAIAGETCEDPEVAKQLIHSKKYEAVVIDFQLGEIASQLLHELRSSSSNRRSVVFALVEQETQASQAFMSGTSFTIEKPVREENALRLIRAAYGMILRERRRYFRCAVSSEIQLSRAGKQVQSG